MSAPDPLDVEQLRAALARIGDEPGWPEADSERLFAALHGDLSAGERRAAVDELVRNPRAAAAWRLAMELRPDQPAAAVQRWSPTWTWMSIAATLLLLVGAAWQFQPWHGEAPVYRGADSGTVASLLPVDGRLSRAQPVLRWTAIAGARYRVRILTPDLTLLDESEDIAAPEYRLKPEALRAIPPGGRILWQVEARTPGNAAVTSPTFSAQVE
ncbi:MAG: hypothetical protein ABJC89_17190 [Acidobacteriota bacterium]